MIIIQQSSEFDNLRFTTYIYPLRDTKYKYLNKQRGANRLTGLPLFYEFCEKFTSRA